MKFVHSINLFSWTQSQGDDIYKLFVTVCLKVWGRNKETICSSQDLLVTFIYIVVIKSALQLLDE